MVSRRDILVLLAASPALAWAQGKSKPGRVGALASGDKKSAEAWVRSFRAAMRELGYGNQFTLEVRFADGKPELLPKLAEELYSRGVRAIVAIDEGAISAARGANSLVVAADIAGPAEIGEQQVRLLTELMPKLSRLAVVVNPGNSSHKAIFNGVGAAAGRRKIRVLGVEALNADEIESAFGLMRSNRVGAAIFAPDGLYTQEVDRIVVLATKHRLPVIGAMAGFAPAGALATCGIDPRAGFRLAAAKVDRVLNGAKEADLAADNSPRLPLVINRKTAKALGVRVPDEVLKRATSVIG